MTIKIPVIIETNTKRLDALDKRFDKLEKKGAKAGNQVGSSFKKAGAAIVGALAVDRIVSWTAEAALMAAEAEKVERAFVNLSGGSATAAENLEAMERATRGALSQTQQMSVASNLLGLQIADSAEDLGEFTETARRLGGTFRGLDAAQSVEDLSLAVSNLSFARLDTFGISATKVRDRVKELTTGVGALDKQTAFFQATMEEADKTMALLGPETENTADKFARLGASTEDFKVSIGNLIEAGGVLEFLDVMINRLTLGAESWAEMANTVGLLSEAAGNVFETFDSDNLDFSFDKVASDFELFKQEFDNVAKAERAATAAADEQAKVVKQLAIESREAAAAIQEQAEAGGGMADVSEDLARDLIDIEKEKNNDLLGEQADFIAERESNFLSSMDRLADIEAAGVKEQVAIAKRLSDGLIKADQALINDRAKIKGQSTKRIKEIRDSAARQEKQERRAERIDAKADEALFNLSLEEAARDGDTLAIEQANRRRAIEETANSEKQAADDTAQQENLNAEISAEKTRAEERLREAEQSARTRRDSLRTEAEEDLIALDEKLAEESALEKASLEERQSDLETASGKRLEDIETGSQEEIEALAKTLTEKKDVTIQELDQLAEIAKRKGLEVGQAFNIGLQQGFEESEAVASLLGTSSPFPTSNAGLSSGLPLTFAEGGTPSTGVPSIVGERGAEGITPNQSVTVHDNRTMNFGAGVSASEVSSMVAIGNQQLIDILTDNLN